MQQVRSEMCTAVVAHAQAISRARGVRGGRSAPSLWNSLRRSRTASQSPPHPPRAPAAPCSTPVPPPLPLFAPCAGGAIRGGYAAGLGVGVTRGREARRRAETSGRANIVLKLSTVGVWAATHVDPVQRPCALHRVAVRRSARRVTPAHPRAHPAPRPLQPAQPRAPAQTHPQPRLGAYNTERLGHSSWRSSRTACGMLSCAGKNGVWEGVGGVGEHTGTRGRNRAPACPPPPSLTSMHPRDRAHASAGRRGHAGGVRAGGKRGLEACPLPGRSPGGGGGGGGVASHRELVRRRPRDRPVHLVDERDAGALGPQAHLQRVRRAKLSTDFGVGGHRLRESWGTGMRGEGRKSGV